MIGKSMKTSVYCIKSVYIQNIFKSSVHTIWGTRATQDRGLLNDVDAMAYREGVSGQYYEDI